MTTLIDTLRADKMSALREGDAGKIKQSILSVVIADGQAVAMTDKKNPRKEPTDSEMISVIRKQIQNNEAVKKLFCISENTDAMEKMQSEIDAIEKYVPQEIDLSEMCGMIKDIISYIPEEERTMKAMGRVMKELKERVAEKELAMNGKMASQIVKEELK